MATFRWAGKNGDWSDPNQWTNGSPPNATDDAVIDATGTYTATVSTLVSVNSVTLNGSGATLDIADGGNLAVGSGGLEADAGTLAIDYNGTLTLGAGTLTLGSAATLDLEDGTIAGGTIANNGATITGYAATLDGVDWQGTFAPAGASITVQNGLTVTGAGDSGPGTIDLSGDFASLDVTGALSVGSAGSPGTITLTGGDASLTFEDTETLDNANISIGNDTQYEGSSIGVGSNGALTLGANVTITQTGVYAGINGSSGGGPAAAPAMGGDPAGGDPMGGDPPAAGSIDNQGNIDATLDGGNFTISGPFTNDGTITVGNGDTVTLEGQFTNADDGTISIENGGTVDINTDEGDWSNAGAVNVAAGGTLDLQIYNMTAADLTGIDNSGTVIIDSDYTNTDATLSVGSGTSLGVVELGANGHIYGGTIEDTGHEMLFEGGSLVGVTYDGTITLTGTESLGLQDFTSSTTVNLGAGTTVFLYSDSTTGKLVLANAAGITNNGGTIDIEGFIDNTGNTLDVGPLTTLGHVRLGGYGTISGGAIDDSNSDMAFAGGTLDKVTYTGTLTLNDGDSVNYSGVTGTDHVDIESGGTLYLTQDQGDPAYTAADLAGVTNNGGTLTIESTYDNSGQTITIGSDPGAFAGTVEVEYGGTIEGGTIVDASSAMLFQGGTLDGVTYEGTLNVGNFLIAAGGLTVETAEGGNPGAIDVGGGTIEFTGTQTLDNVAVTLAGGQISSSGGTGALTLGSSVSVTGTGTLAGNTGIVSHATVDTTTGQIGIEGTFTNDGTITAEAVSGYSLNVAGTLTNNGAIDVKSDADVRIGASAGTDTFTNSATGTITLESSNGIGSFLEIGDNGEQWSSQGTITGGSGDEIDLYGSFDTASLATITNSGGNTQILGTLDNTGATLSVGSGGVLGTVWLEGPGSGFPNGAGVIKGGIVVDSGGFNFSAYDGTFDGVIYKGTNGVLDFSSQYAQEAAFHIADGINVEKSDGSAGTILLTGNSQTLDFDGTQTLDNVTVDIGDSHGDANPSDNLDSTSGTLTLGANAVIDQTGPGATLGGAGAIDNKGSIEATQAASPLDISVATFSNDGTVTASSGGTAEIDPGTFTNFSGGALTGGFYVADADSTVKIAAGSVTTLDADVTLSGTGSTFENSDGSTLASSLTTIGSGRALHVLDARGFTTSNAIADAGTIELGDGTLSDGGLTIESGGVLTGFGTTGDITNDGTITANGGVLAVGAVTGSGSLAIAANATLSIGASAEDASFGSTVGTLELTDPAGFTGAINGLVAGDVIDLAATTVTNASLSGGTLTVNTSSGNLTYQVAGALTGDSFTVSSDGQGGSDLSLIKNTTGAAVATLLSSNPLTLPNAQVGGSDTTALSIENSASPPADALDGGVAQVSGDLSASGSFTGLAAGQTNSSGITVSFDTSTAGARSGTVTLDFTSDGSGSLPDQTVTVSGAVYRLAAAGVNANLPAAPWIVHVGDGTNNALTMPITVTNTAAADGYSENLAAVVDSSSSADLNATGSISGLAAGANSSAITFGLPTNQAGSIQDGVVLDFASDGTGVDGFGQDPLPTVTVPVNATVDNYADPTPVKLSNPNSWGGSLTENSPTDFTYDFGAFDPDAQPETADFDILNSLIGGPQDDLAGTFNIAATQVLYFDKAGPNPPDVFENDGFDDFSDVAAESSVDASGNGLSVTFKPTDDYGDHAGFEEVITLTPKSTNDSGYSGALTPITLDVYGEISKDDSDPAELKVGNVAFGNLHMEAPDGSYPSGPQTLTLPVTVTNGANPMAANLVADGDSIIEGSEGESVTGTTPQLAGGSSDTGSIQVTLNRVRDPVYDVGPFNGEFLVDGTSYFGNGDTEPTKSEEGHYTGTVYEYAKPYVQDSNGDILCDDGHPGTSSTTIHLNSGKTETLNFYVKNDADKTYGDNLEISPSNAKGDDPSVFSNINFVGLGVSKSATGLGAKFGSVTITGPSDSKTHTFSFDFTDKNDSVVPGFTGNLSSDPSFTVNVTSSPPPPPPPPPKPPGPDGGGGGGGGGGAGSGSGAGSNNQGDVHITTFDGLHYDFQAAGEFIASKSTNPNDPFEVQYRLEPNTQFGGDVTTIHQVATRVGTDRVTFDVDRLEAGTGFAWVNGAAVLLSAANPTMTLSGGTLYYVDSHTYVVDYTGGEQLTVSNSDLTFGGASDNYLHADIRLGSSVQHGDVTGLDGNDLGYLNKNLPLSDGTYLPLENGGYTQQQLYGTYADSWRVSQANSLFDYPSGKDTSSYTIEGFPQQPVTIADLPTNVVQAATALANAAGLTDPTLMQDAIYDYAVTGDPSYITNAANEQAHGESKANVTNEDVNFTPPATVLSVVAATQSVVEASSGTTSVTFEVDRTGDTSAAQTIGWAVTAPGAGYFDASAFGGTLPSGNVTIDAGASSAAFTVVLPAGALASTQPEENLQVAISAASGTVGTPTAQTEVVNDQPTAGPASAILSLELVSGSGTLTQDGTAWTLDLGTIAAGSTANAVEVAAVNDAVAPADGLTGEADLVGSGTGFTNSTGGYDKLVPGQAGDAAVITPDTSAAGSYSESLSFSAIDENDSGYFSSISGATLTVTEKIVSTPPAPVLTNVVGQPVNGGKIEVQGGGEAGDTLTLYEGTKQVGSGTVAADGTFDIITTSTFTDGTHTLTATETDAIKLVSAASAGLSVAVDPGAPTLAGVVGQPVNGGTIEVKGSGEAGDKVALFEGTTQVGSGTVAGNGAFDVTTTDTFGDGLHALTATETDAANLTSAASNNLFVYAPDDGAGTITDFAAAAGDKIDLTAFTDIHSFAAVLSSATESNGNTVLDFGNGDTLTLDGIAKASLSVNDFANLASPRGDFNGDGMSDLLWQNDNGRFSIWEMNGTSVITNPTLKVNPGPSWHAIGTGDFNGDGFADILWQNDSGAISIWEMDGTKVISNPTLKVNPGPAWHVIGTGDFNGDGKSDILWQNNSGAISIWEMNGTNVLSNPTLHTNPGSSWHVKDAGDFNGDGFSDILWQNTNGAISIWEMDGTSIVTNPTLHTNPGPSWHVTNAADYNGDGHADIGWQNNSGAISIWEMDGTNIVSNPTLHTNPGPSWHVIGPHNGLTT